ncbi:MAG: methyltransferase family protein [Thermoanaerobaculia bacterium]
MELLRTVADIFAALMLVSLPSALLFWFLIHPFVDFWRRLGPWPSYTIVSAVCLSVAYVLWTLREPLMRVHYGYRPVTIVIGLAVYLAGAFWDRRVLRKLTFPRLAGLPEISSDRPSVLLTDGPYARVRHPRYFGALVGITGFAVMVNYLWLYLMVAVCVPVGWLMILLEERELRRRFGQEYEEYAARVPRFLPRLGG